MAAVAQELIQQHRKREVVAVLGTELPLEIVDLGGGVLGAAHHAGIRLVTGRTRYLEAVAVDQYDRPVIAHQDVGWVHVPDPHVDGVQPAKCLGDLHAQPRPVFVLLLARRQLPPLVGADEAVCCPGSPGGLRHPVPEAVSIGLQNIRPAQRLRVLRRVLAHGPQFGRALRRCVLLVQHLDDHAGIVAVLVNSALPTGSNQFPDAQRTRSRRRRRRRRSVGRFLSLPSSPETVDETGHGNRSLQPFLTHTAMVQSSVALPASPTFRSSVSSTASGVGAEHRFSARYSGLQNRS